MKNLSQYFNNQSTKEEQDKITKVLLQNHYDRTLQERWMKKLEDNYNVSPTQKDKTSSFSLYWKIGAAAASILFLLAIGKFYKSFSQPDTQLLVENHLAEKYDHNSIKKGIGIDDIRTKAVDEYSMGNYERAIFFYTQIVEVEKSNIEDNFFLGLSYLYNQQADQSIPFLQKAIDSPPSDNIRSTTIIEWYLSLAYLKNQQMDKAKVILEQLASENNGQIKEDALKLLRGL